MRARIQTIPTVGGGGGGGGGGVELLLEGGSHQISSRKQKGQLIIFQGRSGPTAPLSPPISEFQTV